MAKRRGKKTRADVPIRNTRSLLINEALHLFARQGFDGTSIKQICDAAGANISSINYHFESKENLLTAIFRERIAEERAKILQVMERAKSTEDAKLRLRLFSEILIEARVRNADFHNLLYREAFRRPAILHVYDDFTKTVRDGINEFFKDAADKGYINRELDPVFVNFIFYAVFIAPDLELAKLLDPAFDFSAKPKRDQYVKNMLRIVFAGIFPASKGA